MLSVSLNKTFPSFLRAGEIQREKETLFTCPYAFKFRTHPLTGTASGRGVQRETSALISTLTL